MFFPPFLKRHHMRDIFNDFNEFLLYIFIDFIAILIYCCVNKTFLTYLYSTDDGITFRKAYANFYFLKKVVIITILILFMVNSFKNHILLRKMFPVQQIYIR